MKKPLTMEEITVPFLVGRPKTVALPASRLVNEQRVIRNLWMSQQKRFGLKSYHD